MVKPLFVFTQLVCVVGAILAAANSNVPLSEMTVVAYNKTDAISAALAKFYAQQRGIPSDHLIGLDCPIEEDVSREDFVATIATPLRDVFKQRQWWSFRTDADGNERVASSSIRFLAIIRGVPLKIRPSARFPLTSIF